MKSTITYKPNGEIDTQIFISDDGVALKSREDCISHEKQYTIACKKFQKIRRIIEDNRDFLEGIFNSSTEENGFGKLYFSADDIGITYINNEFLLEIEIFSGDRYHHYVFHLDKIHNYILRLLKNKENINGLLIKKQELQIQIDATNREINTFLQSIKKLGSSELK